MPPSPIHRWPTTGTVLVSLLAALLLAEPAGAQGHDRPATRRLQLTVELQRQSALGPGTDIGRSRLVQSLTIDVLLHGDGTPLPNNPLDPDDARRQAEHGLRTQRRVQAALAARGLSAAPSIDASQAAALQARGLQIQARCGQDRDCLLREAMALQQQMQALQQVPQAAAAAPADDGEDEPDETPYRLFQGRAGCRLDLQTRVDLRIEGHFADVQGNVPFTQTAKADEHQRDGSRCPLLQAVLDVRDGRLWTNAVDAVPPPRGVHERAERGRRPQRSDGEVALRWHEAEAWLQQRLTRLNAAGEDHMQLPAPGGRTEVTLRWRLAPP
jgi:hypothetical protein